MTCLSNPMKMLNTRTSILLFLLCLSLHISAKWKGEKPFYKAELGMFHALGHTFNVDVYLNSDSTKIVYFIMGATSISDTQYSFTKPRFCLEWTPSLNFSLSLGRSVFEKCIQHKKTKLHSFDEKSKWDLTFTHYIVEDFGERTIHRCNKSPFRAQYRFFLGDGKAYLSWSQKIELEVGEYTAYLSFDNLEDFEEFQKLLSDRKIRKKIKAGELTIKALDENDIIYQIYNDSHE